MKQATKSYPGMVTVATILPDEIPGLFRVCVIHRFDSGNFVTDDKSKHLSLVAAEGLLAFYTS